MNHPVFTVEAMEKKSKACANICAWVLNIVNFSKIYKKVKPLMEVLEAAKSEKESKEATLKIVMARVKEVEEKVAVLQSELYEAEAEKAIVVAKADECQQMLGIAERLVNGLADENKRWGENVISLKKDMDLIVGDALLAAAFVS